MIGWLTIGPVLFGDFFDGSIFVLRATTNPLHERRREEFHGPLAVRAPRVHGSAAVYLAAAGALVAWFLYLKRPELPGS